MSKQLNVSLAFTANTSEAIAQIKNLQKELNNISMGKFGANSPIKSLTPEIQTAMKAASQLQAALEGAVNVQTGKLDLGKFSQSLHANQMKLSDYARQLSALGPTGNKAFLQLANSISQAEMPLMRSNGLLKQLGTTLANTARWQLSSSLLHGFIGSVQKAYGYSKDLNESLNNIRIVTGQSIDQMAKFAEQANKAARALNTTTTAYTDASLIFYQQGLNETEVAKRTETTIKMANVTGQSVETISNQLTAVWNNFAKGGENLEYYADVMTALGAATASSTDEISDGLNKFAAVAETVGLSYEYAASALATVTATTRQSADVVGTAFKTLFARIQDLELGKTLDDGTTLGTYSQALEKVGINIKDTSGEMKRMDTILEEMAIKWDVLGQAEKTALAQSVAGVRQYTQLIALMDNWDFMQDNLKTSYSAEGTLNKQAEIYGESWEAASKKVRASLEKIYKELLNDEFFIDLANFTSEFLDTVGNIIDAFGGVKGILLVIGNLITKIFHTEIANGLNSFAYGIKRLTPAGQRAEQDMKNEAWSAASQLKSKATGNEQIAESGALEQEVSLQRKLLANANRLSEDELKQYQIRLDSVRAIQEQAKEQAKVADTAKRNVQTLQDELRIRAKLKASTKARSDEQEKVYKEVSGDRSAVEAQHIAEQNALRAKREAEIRAKAEADLRSRTPKTQQVGTHFTEQVTAAGNAAVAASAESIDKELQELAAKQAADYEATLAKRMEQAKSRIDAAGVTASEQAGKDIDSHTAVMADLGKTKGVSKRLSSSTSQRATKDMGIEDTRAAAQNAIQDLRVLKGELHKLNNKGLDIVSDKELKDIGQLTKALQTLLDDPNADAEALKKKLSEVADTAVNIGAVTENAIVQSAAGAETGSSVQMDSADYIAIAEGAEAAEVAQNHFNNTMGAGRKMAKDLGDDIDGAGARMLSMADKITYGAQAAMSFGMVLSSLDGMISTLFDDDMSGWEKFISIVTTLGMMLPMIISGFDALNKITAKNTVTTATNTGAQLAQAGATKIKTKAVAGEIPIVQANAAAWYSHPIMWIAAIIIGIVAAFSIYNNILEKNAEKVKENAEEAIQAAEEVANASQEELDTIRELSSAYDELYDKYIETGEGKTEYVAKTEELLDQLDIENGYLLLAQGRYEELNKEIKKYLGLKAQENKKNAKDAFKVNVQEGGKTLQVDKTNKTFIGDAASEAGHEGQSAMGFWDIGANDTWLTNYLPAEGPWEIVGDKLVAYYSNDDQIPYLQEELARIYQQAIDKVGGVSALTDAQKSGSFYSNYVVGIQQGQNETASKAWNGIAESGKSYITADLENTLYEADVQTLSEYYAVREQWLNQMVAQAVNDGYNIDEATSYYNKILEEWAISSPFGELEKGYRAESSQRENFAASKASKSTSYDALVEEYGEEAVLQTSIEPWMDQNALELAISSTQDRLNRANLTASVDVVFDSIDKFDSNMSKREFDKWWEENPEVVKLLQEQGYEKDTFGVLSAKEQQNILEEIKYSVGQQEESTQDLYRDYYAKAELEKEKREDYEGLESVENPGTRTLKGFDIGQTDPKTGKPFTYADFEHMMMMASQTNRYEKYDWDTHKTQGFTNADLMKIITPMLEKGANFNEQSFIDMLSTNTYTQEGIDKIKNLYGDVDIAALNKVRGVINVSNPYTRNAEGFGLRLDHSDFDFFDVFYNWGSHFSDNYDAQQEYDAKKQEYDDYVRQEGEYKGYLSSAERATSEAKEKVDQAEAEVGLREQYAERAEIIEAGFNLEEIEEYAEVLRMANEEMIESEAEAKRIALANAKTQRGLDELVNSYEDLVDGLDDKNKGTLVYSQSLTKLKTIMKDILNFDDAGIKLLGDDFLTSAENMELMKRAAEGDLTALDELHKKASQKIIQEIEVDSQYQDELTTVTDFINDFDFDLKIGTSLDSEGLSGVYLGLQELLNNGQITVDQMNNILSGIGFTPKVDWQEVKVKSTSADGLTSTVEYYDPVSGELQTRTVSSDNIKSTDGVTFIPILNGSKTSFKGPPSGGTSNTGEKKKGGGGSKPKKADKVKKSDVVERYKEINDQLEETAHLMNKTNAAAEGLWGEARFKKMREGVELLKQENQQLKERMKWSKNYVDEDRKALDDAATAAGISFQYDKENGYITNYTEQMTWLYNQLDNAINNANADGNATEEEQEEIDKWQKYIDDIESARGDYEDALEQWREDEEKWLENRNKIWQDNFDILNEELELKVQLNTQDLEVLQYFLDKIEDAVYGIAEAFASGKYFENQFANYSANLGLLSNETNDPKTQGFYQNLQDQYRNGEIGLPQYKQGLADMMGMTIENLESLQDLKESMQDFYGDVMEKALEEIAIYTDSMENLNSVLDHYSNILELVGKQDDYASKNKVLSSKAKNLRNEIDVQKRLYEESAADAAYWAQKMNEAEVGSNEYETYKKNWQAAEAAAQESQDAMLSKTQEWAEAMKAIIENELADFADQLEKSLTGGVSFDELMTSMERRSSLQEEYLTTTNKIYETNKLMRTAQQEIDKTSNTVAKRRMAQFISETQQLQNKNKLSQYELDIQQAKYDLLLAEIALEEAQDAKSVVRLQRDAEGNFGYVYTADQNAVADAEQQLADAQNSLYNIGLEGANNYQQKYAETLQESQEAITELTQMWMNGEISSEEEFNRRKQEIVEYYGEKLQQYSDLHSIALTTDSRVVKDAWSSDFTSMTASVDVWKQNVGTYFSQAGESMKDWADICAQTLEDSGLDDMDQTLGDIDQKSKDLKNTLIGEDGKSGVVAAMMAEVDAAGQLSEEYIAIQDAIDGVIAEYEELLKILNEDYQSPTGPGDEDGKQNGEEEEEEEEEEETPDDSTPPPAAAQLSVGSTVKVKTSASKWVSGEGIWGPVKGNNFKVMQISGEKVLIGDPCGPNYTASGVTGWIKKTDLEGFDTGGYTGDWSGAYGKLALLHKKELILKEGDTANFLAGMDLLNKIISVIDLQSVNNSLGGLLSSPSLGHVGDEGGILEQQVHIEASFPGVSDHSEIEEAFNNLVNQAAQYANRK